VRSERELNFLLDRARRSDIRLNDWMSLTNSSSVSSPPHSALARGDTPRGGRCARAAKRRPHEGQQTRHQ
jgi:hypothetical protein